MSFQNNCWFYNLDLVFDVTSYRKNTSFDHSYLNTKQFIISNINVDISDFQFQNEFNTTMVHCAACGWNQYDIDISCRISTEIVSIKYRYKI